MKRSSAHPKFKDNTYTTRFIDTTPELFQQVKRQDRATKLLTYLADVTVNGHPEAKGRPEAAAPMPQNRSFLTSAGRDQVDGTKQIARCARPEEVCRMGTRNEKRVLLTDTTMRDGHQSLLATRVRTL